MSDITIDGMDLSTGFEDELGDQGTATAVAEPTGPACAKCEAPFPHEAMSACPRCGWYAAMNTYIEIAPEWEQSSDTQAPPAPVKSHLEVWATLIPAWGWLLMATTIAVVAASVGVRLYTADNESLRTTWSVLQLFLGVGLVMVCHLLAFFMAATVDPDMGAMDLVVSPLKGWMRLFRGLPHRFWLLNSANVCLTAVLCTFIVIGGLPYDEVWNWGFKPPAKKNLLGAIAEKAGAGQGEEQSMEEAMGSFAQNAAVDGNLPEGAKPKEPSGETARQTIDALIIGYELTPQGKIDRFLLATENIGKLLYAGRVRPVLTEEQAAELPARLSAARAPRPFINVPGAAIWLQPRFTCRVTYHKRVESGMLQGMIWEDLLGEVKQ